MSTFYERLREAELRSRDSKKVIVPAPPHETRRIINEPSFAEAKVLFVAHAMPIFEEIARLKGISIDQDPFKRGNSVFHKFAGGYILPQTNGFIRYDDPNGNAVEGALIWDISYGDKKKVHDSAEFRVLRMRVNPTKIFVHNWYEPGDIKLQEEIIEILLHNGDFASLYRVGGHPFFTPSESIDYGYSDPGAP